ncbi:MAG: GNAT family N-acetyltransferase, partial [Planctomycetota bacterium]
MDYHSDRYHDYSLLFYNEDNKLLAVMPANIKDDHVHSHVGLTYGGIISDTSMKAAIMTELFEHLLRFLKDEKIKKLHYK